MEKAALILEGGGFRGVWTSGVLDVLMDEELWFAYTVGVSMGACNGASYISRQRGRNKVVNTAFVNEKRYMSWRRWARTGELFGMDFIFREVPEQLVPFDFQMFKESPQDFEVVGTNCESGQPVYFDKAGRVPLMHALQASISLPLVANEKWIEDKPFLDGGIADPIPIQRAMEKGYERLVVVLTQPRNYDKKPLKLEWLVKQKYKQYPALVDQLITRHARYNAVRDRLFKLEEQGKAFVIAPEQPIEAGRIEKDIDKLLVAYDQGVERARALKPALRAFLDQGDQGKERASTS